MRLLIYLVLAEHVFSLDNTGQVELVGTTIMNLVLTVEDAVEHILALVRRRIRLTTGDTAYLTAGPTAGWAFPKTISIVCSAKLVFVKSQPRSWPARPRNLISQPSSHRAKRPTRSKPHGGEFVWVRAPSPAEDRAAYENLQELGIGRVRGEA